jgi:serine/threonine-protein kinase
VRPFTSLDSTTAETSHRWPEMLPSGRAVIFTAGPPAFGDWYDATIVAQSLDRGKRQVLIRGAAQAHYVSPGYLAYARAGTVFAVPFDERTLRVTGTPVAVLEGVREDQSQGAAQFTVSANGSLAYVPGGLSRNDLVWVDRRGKSQPLKMREQVDSSPSRVSRPTAVGSPSPSRVGMTMSGCTTWRVRC